MYLILLFNINSVFIYFFYNNLKLVSNNHSNKKSLLKFFFKNDLNFFFYIQSNSFKKYYYFFKYFLKIDKFFFVKCAQLLLNSYIQHYINIIYSITGIGINFFFLSNQTYFNLLWNMDINFFFKNFTKNSFIRFIINFFKKKNIKLLVFFDTRFLNLLPFFKKMNFLTCGFISVKNNSSFLDLPLFFDNTSIFNRYFFFNLTYKVYLLSLYHKYLNTFYSFVKNYNKHHKLLIGS